MNCQFPQQRIIQLKMQETVPSLAGARARTHAHHTRTNSHSIFHRTKSFSKCWRLLLFKKFSEFRGTWSFIIVWITSCHVYPSRATWIQFTPPLPIHLRPILLLYSHLWLGLPSGIFVSCLSTTSEYAFLFPLSVLYAPTVSSSLIWSLW